MSKEARREYVVHTRIRYGAMTGKGTGDGYWKSSVRRRAWNASMRSRYCERREIRRNGVSRERYG